MMSYIIWDVDPRIIEGVDFLRWYGLCWAIGMMLGYQMLQKIYKAERLNQASLDTLATYLIVGIIIGARIGHILFYDPLYYWQYPIELLPFRLNPTFQFTGIAGLASHGGIAGALIALYFYNKKFKLGYLFMLDRLIIVGALVGGFIRLGNLLNSEIIGKATQLPWAFIFTRVDQIPRHPTQLYEASFYFIIFLLLFLIWKSKKFNNERGFLFGLGISFIFIQRFLIEFFKENQVAFEEQMILNMGQLLSIPLILIGIYVMLKRNTRFAK